jgi:hypothetical protein
VTDNVTHIENDYLTRLIAHMRTTTPNTLLEAERQMLYAEVKSITAERDAAVASTMAAYEPELSFRRDRIAAIEGKMAGEQVSLFKVTPVQDTWKVTDNSVGPATKEEIERETGLSFNEAMGYAAKYPASQEPIGAVIPCSTDEASKPVERTDGFTSTFNALSDWLDNNPEAMYHTPKNAQVVNRDGQTFFVFKSAGYKAIAERLGFPYRPMMDGYKRYLLTPKEYNDVFVEHKKMESQREHS